MRSSRIAVLDAPSNLGLRPPSPSVVPGCYKLAGSLRDHRIVDRLGAEDAGCVTPPRYDRHEWAPGQGVANASGLAHYTTRLADRVSSLLRAGTFPLLLGGDCSILLGAALAMRRQGRFGVAFLDGHSDFRHGGNSSQVGSAAGEDLALVTGRGQVDLTDLEGLSPYVDDSDVVVMGVRSDDEYLEEMREVGIAVWTVGDLGSEESETALAAGLSRLENPDLDGFWIHLDVDVLDPELMPAVDSPTPGGLDFDELVTILGSLLASPRSVGLDVTVFDPDFDPEGTLAGRLTDTLVAAFSRVWPLTTSPPDQ
jgi:arginase